MEVHLAHSSKGTISEIKWDALGCAHLISCWCTSTHTRERGQWRGTQAYPLVGGVDIFSENSPLVSAAGFMISVLSRFHHNFSLLFHLAGVCDSVSWLVRFALKRVKIELNRLVLHRRCFSKCTQRVIIPRICCDIWDVRVRPASRRLVMMLDWMPVSPLAAAFERSNPALN